LKIGKEVSKKQAASNYLFTDVSFAFATYLCLVDQQDQQTPGVLGLGKLQGMQRDTGDQ
jgi:hypothetical protein